MNKNNSLAAEATDRQWYIVWRWQTYSAELRVLIVRVAAVTILYAWHLWMYQQFGGLVGPHQAVQKFLEHREIFHQGATLIAALLLLSGCITLLLVLNRRLPVWLPYLISAIDILAITVLMTIAGGPQQMALTGVLYLVVVLSGLRFDLRLLRFVTVAAVLGAMAGLVAPRFHPYEIGELPLSFRGAMTITLALTGIIVGQIVRLARTLAEQYHQRMVQVDGKERP